MKINKDTDVINKKLKMKNKSKLNRGAVQEKVKSVKQYKLNELLVEGYKNQGHNLSDWETTVIDNWD